MQPEDLLRKYADVCEGKRKYYGDFLASLQRIGKLFEIMSGVALTRSQVATFLLCLKLSREAFAHGEDNCGDACAYIGAIHSAHQVEELEAAVHGASADIGWTREAGA